MDSKLSDTEYKQFSDEFLVLYQTKYCAEKDSDVVVCMDRNIRVFKKYICFSEIKTSKLISFLSLFLNF